MKMNTKKVAEHYDLQRRDKHARISPMQFLRSRNKYTCETRIIINDDNNDKKDYWLEHIDFEKRFWYKVFGLIKEQCSLNEK